MSAHLDIGANPDRPARLHRVQNRLGIARGAQDHRQAASADRGGANRFQPRRGRCQGAP